MTKHHWRNRALTVKKKGPLRIMKESPVCPDSRRWDSHRDSVIRGGTGIVSYGTKYLKDNPLKGDRQTSIVSHRNASQDPANSIQPKKTPSLC